MKVFTPVEIITEIAACKVAIQFKSTWLQIDPRAGDQSITTCYIRPLDGPRTLYVGAAVISPNDIYDIPLYGKKLALGRAIQAFLHHVDPKACYDMARKIVFDWLRAQEEKAALEQALQELDQIMANATVLENDNPA